MKKTKHFGLVSVALLGVLASATVWSPAASAHGSMGVGIIGGLLAGHVLTKFSDRDKERTEDMNSMAADQQRQAYAPPPPAAPVASASSSPEARMKQLDKLAAGGYITPAQYKAKKKEILDSM